MPDKDGKEGSRDRIDRMTDWPEKIIIGDNFKLPKHLEKKPIEEAEGPGTTPQRRRLALALRRRERCWGVTGQIFHVGRFQEHNA